MSCIEDLRAEAQKLYEQALKIKDGDERLVLILRAMELETEADVLERRPPPLPTPGLERPVAQQQQQPQAKDESEAE